MPKKEPEAMDVEAEPEPELPTIVPRPEQVSLESCKSSLELVERAVRTKEVRYVSRAMRQTAGARKGMSQAAMALIASCLPDSELKALAAAHISKVVVEAAPAMEVEAPSSPRTPRAAEKEEKKTVLDDKPLSAAGMKVESPDAEVYVLLVALQFLLDHKAIDAAHEIASSLLAYCQEQDRRSLDPLMASVWFYYSLVCEKKDALPQIRPKLLAAYRTAVLNRDDQGQATYLNLLLRNYLTPSGGELRLVEQADKLVSLTKSTFPESASNNQFARYFYYTGMIKTIQLEYSEALNYLQEALRKAPQDGVVGFRITVSKWIVIVQLLKGEIPERALFTSKPAQLRTALAPYLALTQAVRNGDLALFKSVADGAHRARFEKDGLLTLINRLRHNVIKTGLRNINTAYACISIADVCEKLRLEDTDDAEYIVAKAIRDGVIDAQLDHKVGVLRCNANPDVYVTAEPQELYHKRIQFCLNIRNEAIQAMSYPDDTGKEKKESAEERLEQLKQEAELAQNIAEEEGDEF